jgi:TPR repeat protein
MNFISIAAVANLTDQSERTLRRRIAAGQLTRIADVGGNKTMIPFQDIREQIVIPMNPEDIALIDRADGGDPEAQNALALLFFVHGKPDNAIYWLELAAKQDYADAMHWLGRAYLDGSGVPQDANHGLMWLAKAAVCGHPISQAQMQAMRDSFLTPQ